MRVRLLYTRGKFSENLPPKGAGASGRSDRKKERSRPLPQKRKRERAGHGGQGQGFIYSIKTSKKGGKDAGRDAECLESPFLQACSSLPHTICIFKGVGKADKTGLFLRPCASVPRFQGSVISGLLHG